MATTMALTESSAVITESAAPLFVERRRGPRYQFTATVELVDLKSRAKMEARTADLSAGGCYVDTTSPLPADTPVKMRLTKNGRSFTVEARVAYALPGMGMGLAFTSADTDQVAILKRWIGELSGALAPELSAPEPGEVKRDGRGSDSGPASVLSALISDLMRQGVLSNQQGNTMLAQLA